MCQFISSENDPINEMTNNDEVLKLSFEVKSKGSLYSQILKDYLEELI